jgi:hypothetical protein
MEVEIEKAASPSPAPAASSSPTTRQESYIYRNSPVFLFLQTRYLLSV